MRFTKGNYLPGGGVSVSKSAFDFSEPGLESGVAFYGPVSGELLLDAWVEVDVAFDGTGDLADIGTTFPGGKGFFGQTGGACELSFPDVLRNTGTVLGSSGSDVQRLSLVEQSATATSRIAAPARFVTTDVLRLVVSVDGLVATPVKTVFVFTGPLTVVAGVNDELVFNGPPGGTAPPITVTLAAGIYATLDGQDAALQAALTLAGVIATVTNNGADTTTVTLTDWTQDDIGDTFTPGANDVSGGLGMANPQTFTGTGLPTGATHGSGIVYVVTALAS